MRRQRRQRDQRNAAMVPPQRSPPTHNGEECTVAVKPGISHNDSAGKGAASVRAKAKEDQPARAHAVDLSEWRFPAAHKLGQESRPRAAPRAQRRGGRRSAARGHQGNGRTFIIP